MSVGTTQARHHRVIPVIELGLGLFRKAQDLADHADRELIGENLAKFNGAAVAVILDQIRAGGSQLVPVVNHFVCEAFNRRNPVVQRLANEVLTIEISAPAVFNPGQFQLCVAKDTAGRTLRYCVEALVIEVALGDVIVTCHPVAVMQFVMKHRIVISQDAVIRVGVSKELR